jgi:hypothetical protein
LEQFNAAFAHEPGGVDEAGEVHTAVLDGELGVRRKQLFLLVEDGVPMLLLLHVVVEAVALHLEPFALGLALGTAECVRVVAVGHREYGEVAGAGDADLAGVDGRGQAGEDQRGRSGGDDGGRRAFDLCTLAVHGDVVNGVADFLLVVFGGVKGKGDQGRHDQGEEGE